MAAEPYRWRLKGHPDESKGLITVCSFEQDTLPGNFLYFTQDSDDGSIQVKTKFKVRDTKRVKETSDRGIPNSELFVEVVERVQKGLLRNYAQKLQAPFNGCGRVKPIHILRGDGSLSARKWSNKCGAERGIDSGQYFICSDCASIFGYHR